MRLSHQPFLKVFGLLVLLTSCLKDMPESIPETLVWNPSLAFPLGSDQFGMNAKSGFNTTLFALNSITQLPQWVNQMEVVLEGRVPFDLASLNQTDEINQLMFRVGIYNGFPERAMAQAYFMADSITIIDSMFINGAIIVPPGKIIGNGETIDPAVIRKNAIFKGERIATLEDATEILLRAVLIDPGADSTLYPYYPNYHMDLEVGIMLDITMTEEL